MKTGGRLYVIVSIVALVAVVAVLALTSPSIDQPIAFNHRLHVQDLGADCTDCHLYALTGVRATIPNVDSCGVCHIEAFTESAEEVRLLEHVESESPIPWRKIYEVPDHVYFSHRRHAAIAEIDCETCHGLIGEREQPVTRPLVQTTMDECILCHDKEGASTDCIACHR